MANESVTRGIVRQLKMALYDKMPELQSVIEEWPKPNEQLKYPCVSIQWGSANFAPCAPYVWQQGQKNDIHRASVLWVNGQWEWELQLDLWARSKNERHELVESIQRAFASQFPVMGLSLELSDYYKVTARYELSSIAFEDSEVGAQTREWRAMMSVRAHCHSIYEKVENVMTAVDVEVQATENILMETTEVL